MRLIIQSFTHTEHIQGGALKEWIYSKKEKKSNRVDEVFGGRGSGRTWYGEEIETGCYDVSRQAGAASTINLFEQQGLQNQNKGSGRFASKTPPKKCHLLISLPDPRRIEETNRLDTGSSNYG